MNTRINSVDSLLEAVTEYGILTFWDEKNISAWTLSGVTFNTLWSIRENAVNTKRIVYGKFARNKSAFVSLDLFPHLAALRRDGYDYDSLVDEGRAIHRETLIMDAVIKTKEPTPSYALGKSIGIKGFDSAVASLQNKTFLCLTFKKSYMGTALLSRPEDLFGYDFVRSCYNLSNEQNRDALINAKGLSEYDEKTLNKILSPAV